MWTELLVFAGVMALGQFSPGPDMLLLTRTALARGRTAGWWTAFGISTGLCAHAAVAIGGMAYLIARGGWVAAGMRWAAAAYLAWLGYQLCVASFVAFCSGVKYGGPRAVSGDGAMAFWRRGLFCNLLNPKVALFFAGVVAPFLAGDRPAWWPALLWTILVGEGLILWGLWVWVLQFQPIRGGYEKAGKWIDAAFGVGLISLAVALVLG
jgi:threonine efflux protein